MVTVGLHLRLKLWEVGLCEIVEPQILVLRARDKGGAIVEHGQRCYDVEMGRLEI